MARRAAVKDVVIAKGVISRDEALKISKDYVEYKENGDYSKVMTFVDAVYALKKGQEVLTHHAGKFLIAKVSSVDNDSFQAVDGPVVRVSNGEYSWRIDGSGLGFPVPKKKGKTKPLKQIITGE